MASTSDLDDQIERLRYVRRSPTHQQLDAIYTLSCFSSVRYSF